MKKFLSMLAMIAMILSLTATSNASDVPDGLQCASSENVQTVEMEKVGERDGFVYFQSTIECEIVGNPQSIGVSVMETKPILATLTTAVNKTAGKVGFTIALHPGALVSTAVCSSAQVSGAMGSAIEFNLKASNFIPTTDIYINHIFDGLKTGVESGFINVWIGAGTFSGPFGLSGTFSSVVRSINLADC